MNQRTFTGQIGQVVCGDLINVGSDSLWQCSTQDLIAEQRRCTGKLWQMRRELIFNFPVLFMVCGIISGIWMLFSGTLFQQGNQILLFGWMIVSFMIPSIFIVFIRQKKGKMIAYYRLRLEIIDMILQDRN